MTAPLSYNDARQLLGYVILDANDIRDHLSKRNYSDLLADAFATIAIIPDTRISEASARAILRRAKLAAKAAGIFGDPRIPGKQVLGVLRAAASGRRSGR